jgi:hypothetical protein
MSDMSGGAIKFTRSTSDATTQSGDVAAAQVAVDPNRANLAANLMRGKGANKGAISDNRGSAKSANGSILGFIDPGSINPEQARLQTQLENIQQDQRAAYQKQRELREELAQKSGSFSPSRQFSQSSELSDEQIQQSALEAGKFMTKGAGIRRAIALSASGKRVMDGESFDTSGEITADSSRVNSTAITSHREPEQRQGASSHTVSKDLAPEDNKASSGWFGSLGSTIGGGFKVVGLGLYGLGKLAIDGVDLLGKAAISLVTDPVGSAKTCMDIGGKVLSVGATVGGFLVRGAASLATWCWNHPLEAVGAVANGVLAVGKFAVSMVVGLVAGFFDGCLKVARGEMSVGQAVLNTFLFCCEVSGLSDLVLTGYHGLLALGAYATGDKTALATHLALAAMHGFWAGLAIATVTTGGVLAPVTVPLMAGKAAVGMVAKQGIKACVKNLLVKGSEQISKEAIQKMGMAAVKKLGAESPAVIDDITRVARERLGTEASESALRKEVNELAFKRYARMEGDNIALSHGKSLSDDVASQGRGVLNAEHLGTSGDKIGYERVKGLYQELGSVDHIDDLTHDSLVKFGEMSNKEARKHLVDTYQMSNRQAAQTAKEMKKLIDSGKSDQAIKEILVDGISKDIWKVAGAEIKAGYTDTFKKALRGELKGADNAAWSANLRREILEHADDLAKSKKTNPHGKHPTQLADDITDDLVKAGAEGVERGGLRATREVVEEGVERALKRLAMRRLRGHAGGAAASVAKQASRDNHEEQTEDNFGVEGFKEGDKKSGPSVGEGHQPEVEQYKVVRDGKIYLVTNVYNDAKDLLRSVQEVISEADNTREKPGSVRVASQEGEAMGKAGKTNFSLGS